MTERIVSKFCREKSTSVPFNMGALTVIVLTICNLNILCLHSQNNNYLCEMVLKGDNAVLKYDAELKYLAVNVWELITVT